MIKERKATKLNLIRARRLNAGLNKAIRLGEVKKIQHWQKLMLPYYEIPLWAWKISQKG